MVEHPFFTISLLGYSELFTRNRPASQSISVGRYDSSYILLLRNIHTKAPVSNSLTVLLQGTLRKLLESIFCIKFAVALGVGDEGQLLSALLLNIRNEAILQHTTSQATTLQRVIHCQDFELPRGWVFKVTICTCLL